MASRKPSQRAVRLAIIGTGGMAQTHAKQFSGIPGCTLAAACDIDRARVEAFCTTHGIPAAFTRVDELLAQSECDAVSIVTPDALHAPLALQCLGAGRHVLCEKPLALNHADARRMAAAARRAGKVNLVNFSYRNWPALEGVAGLIRRGGIGDLRHVESSYLQAWIPSRIWGDWRKTPAWLWRLSTCHGSRGVLGDIGVHIVDFTTYPAGAIRSVHCRLKAFPKAPGGRVGKYRLDANDSAVLDVEFANGALGTIHTTRWCGGHANRLFLRIAGTRGTVEIDSDRSTTAYRVCAGRDLDSCTWREVEVPAVPTIYERFITAIRRGGDFAPDFARGAAVQKVLDACFASDATQRPVTI